MLLPPPMARTSPLWSTTAAPKNRGVSGPLASDQRPLRGEKILASASNPASVMTRPSWRRTASGFPSSAGRLAVRVQRRKRGSYSSAPSSGEPISPVCPPTTRTCPDGNKTAAWCARARRMRGPRVQIGPGERRITFRDEGTAVPITRRITRKIANTDPQAKHAGRSTVDSYKYRRGPLDLTRVPLKRNPCMRL